MNKTEASAVVTRVLDRIEATKIRMQDSRYRTNTIRRNFSAHKYRKKPRRMVKAPKGSNSKMTRRKRRARERGKAMETFDAIYQQRY
jgi:hypothetical protein